MFEAHTTFEVKSSQNIRVTLVLKDFLSKAFGDTSLAKLQINMTLEYSDGSVFDAYKFSCATQCIDGEFNGKIDLINARTDTVKVFKICQSKV